MLTIVKDWLDKLEKWAFKDDELSTAQTFFRTSVYVVVSACLEFVFTLGLVMTAMIFIAKFFIKDTEE